MNLTAVTSLLFRVFCLMLLTAVGVVAEQRPNVLLVTADDLGLQLSCYGDSTVATPHLDRLAAHGVRFETAYVAQASCSPSRSAMFTGFYPHTNGHYGLANANAGFQLHPAMIDRTLPNMLKQAGYRTGLIGKLHVNPEASFEFDLRAKEGFGERDVRQQVVIASEFIAASADEPWFLMFNVFDPHVGRARNPDGSRGAAFFPDVVQGIPADPVGQADVSPWPWQQIGGDDQLTKIAGYYNCVQRIDAAIGRLIESLKQAGVADQTLIIFLGDHGPPFARGKTSCYEAGLRVPFLVSWPGVSKPHVSASLVSSVDIVPTVLDAVGLEIPADLQGKSLRPVLRPDSDPADWRQTLVGEFHFHGASPFFPRRAITDGRYKLIHNLRAGELNASSSIDGDGAYQQSRELAADDPVRQVFDRLVSPPEWELYDLRSDPIEFENRADDTSLADVQSQLQAALAEWQKATNDPFVDPKFRAQVESKHQPQRAR